jgi:hypothetical protein
MKKEAFLYGLIFLLVLLATTTGAFYHTPEPHIVSMTLRGQEAVFQGSGLYRYDPVSLVREGVIWDVINLFIGLPLFAMAIFISLRNTLRGRLLLGGLLAYFWYVYIMYATMIAFNNLFLVYVAIFSLSMVAFALNISHINVAGLPDQISQRFPRRLFIGFSYALSATLLILWLSRIISIMVTNQFPADMAGLTTLEPQALDLGFVVPLSLSSGILLWRRLPWGYYLTSLVVTFGFMMFITIPTWIAVPLLQEGTINLMEAAPFLVLCLVGRLAISFYANIREELIDNKWGHAERLPKNL